MALQCFAGPPVLSQPFQGDGLPSLTCTAGSSLLLRPSPSHFYGFSSSTRRHSQRGALPVVSWRTRRKSRGHVSSACAGLEDTEVAGTSSMELPCLPFKPSEVFVPSSSKTLHLYEARFLSLLEEVQASADKVFGHIVVEPLTGQQKDGGPAASFVATYGCLARVENVRRMQIGALVSIRGIGRLKLQSLTQVEPFLKGQMLPMKDDEPSDPVAVAKAVVELEGILSDIENLQGKLRSSPDIPTPLERARQWVEKIEEEAEMNFYVPSKAERLSFAALQPVEGASAGELHRLLQRRLSAMETKDTLERLEVVTEFAKENRATLAAKAALKSLRL